ncbi:2Fe-2S iron-sulfur cluster-binding protein [Desertibacillus haloalkaliphilus]|uniref:2Fe-2S iron-sulfur cluster-binding protein n=1 Tax=Desertibacillus haloalkaliphilus TaxID=1328930 RepID=UPI001C268893|nr:2Fe-2S iron-sulfur cluster-binding protein [Desertibacillus haloalkaliphilus]MBU8906026.1 2Fe-2S iron-sulfur cluster binding domain-containing protein [Desertibacillus haloalkaliphilus]
MNKLAVKMERQARGVHHFNIEHRDDMTVLDVLEEIYRNHDASVAYRFSCRIGLCATCMMMINGKPGLSCMKRAEPGCDGTMSLAPFLKGNTIRDLVKEV